MVTDEDEKLVFSFDSRAILYTSTAAVLSNIYKFVCLNRGCILRWNGAEEYIFCLSAQVCVGDKICRDFVDLITMLKCNFSAFCRIMNAKYARRGKKAGKFVSPKTFRSLLFSWASYQKIDFWNPCHWYGNILKMLAADATRVGICFKNTNLMPLEKFDSSAAKITIKNRRFDRCFLPYHNKATEITTTQRKLIKQKIREAHIHMRTIMSSSNGFLAQPSLSEELLNLRNNQLLEVFPEGRALLKHLYEISVSECQCIATTKLFYLLSFDALERSLLPVCLLQPLGRLCNNIPPKNLEEFLGRARGISPTLG